MTIGPQTSWTAERGEKAKTLYLKGWSASQIARELGAGLSRNSIIGKLHRMGVSRPPIARQISQSLGNIGTRRGNADRALSAKARQLHANTPPPPREPLPVEKPVAGAVPMECLAAHMCKWPLGDPSKAGFGFCGAPMGDRAPYCDAHARRAFVAINLKSDASAARHSLLCAA